MALAITEGECEQIRKAIDIRLDEVTLPDPTILLDIYAGYAVRRINDRLPNLASGDEPEALTACIYTCAALLIPAIKQTQGEKIAGHEKTFKPFDWDKKIKELEGRVDQIIGSILDAGSGSTNSVMPTFAIGIKAKRADRW